MRTMFFVAVSLFMNLLAFGQKNDRKLIISQLTKNFYVYTTFGDSGDGSLFPANGMYVLSKQGVILFDTPWDATQFQPLLDSIKLRHKQKVIMCISTHFHEDRTGGLQFYRQKGIKTYTTKQTDVLSSQKGMPRAENLIYQDTVFSLGQTKFATFYPGKGHSPDNIVIWFEKEKILYGGCFVKSVEASGPGNLSDANIDDWIMSIEKVQTKFPNPKFVVTGHQDWTDKKSLTHTLNILKEYNQKKGK